MSSLYYRNKTVWIGYSIKNIRIDRSTKIKVKVIKYDKEGKPIFPTEALAEQRKTDARIELNNIEELRHKKINKITTQEAFDRFIAEYGGTKSQSTIRLYKLGFSKLKELFGEMYIRNLKYSDFYEFRKHWLEKDGEQNTANYLRHLSSFFNWAASDEVAIIEKSPITRKVKIYPSPKPPEIFTPQELNKLEKHSDPKLWNQIRFLLLTGFRSGESCTLTWDALNFKEKIITHHNVKGKRWNNYPMYKELREFLFGLPRNGSSYVFHYRNSSGLYHAFRDVMDKDGIKMRSSLNVHTLKETYIYRLITNPKLSFSEVHYLSHHKEIATTMKYYAFFNIKPIRAKLD
jgi:integrase